MEDTINQIAKDVLSLDVLNSKHSASEIKKALEKAYVCGAIDGGMDASVFESAINHFKKD